MSGLLLKAMVFFVISSTPVDSLNQSQSFSARLNECPGKVNIQNYCNPDLSLEYNERAIHAKKFLENAESETSLKRWIMPVGITIGIGTVVYGLYTLRGR